MHLLHSNYSSFPLEQNGPVRINCLDYQEKGFFYDNSAVLDKQENAEFESKAGEQAELDALLDRMLDIEACTGSYGGGGGESGSAQFYHQQQRRQQQVPEQERIHPLPVLSSGGEFSSSGFFTEVTTRKENMSDGTWNTVREQSEQQQQRSLYSSTFYTVGPPGYYQYGNPNYNSTAGLISFAPPNPTQQRVPHSTQNGPLSTMRPVSGLALHRQKLFQMGRTVSNPEVPTPPLLPGVAINTAASPESLSSSASSLYLPGPTGHLSHSLSCVDEAANAIGRYTWGDHMQYRIAQSASMFLPPQQQSGSPSPSHSDHSRSPTSTVPPTAHLFPSFGDASFIFQAHGVAASPREPNGAQQMLCAVCSDIAACMHYGVRTCEGCKGFFKRTVQKNAKYVCLANRDCVIDKRRRNRCQYCRFQKCLAMGMVKEVVRTDSLKGRRGRLPSKSKLTNDEGIGATGGATGQLQPLTKALVHTFINSGSPTGPCAGTHDTFMDSVMVGLQSIRALAERIPGWHNIHELDRDFLLEQSGFYALSLRLAYKSMSVASEQKIVCDDGLIYSQEECPSIWGPWFQSVLSLSIQLRDTLEIDMTAFCCLCALSLVFQEYTGLHNIEEIDKLKNSLINCLKEHCTYSSEAKIKPQYFARILSILTELHSIYRLAKDAYTATINSEYKPILSSPSTSFLDESIME